PTPSRRAGGRTGIRTRPQLFGRVVRTSTWLHRVPTGWKLAAIAVIGLTALVFRNGVVNWSIFVVLVVL
ncbi:energy-coupling factor transporter transmembrane protein EcfT, partial [Burkholderia multivorans]